MSNETEKTNTLATTKSSLYPAYSIENVIEFLLLTKNYPAGRPISYEAMAESCGLKSSNTKSLKYRISSAKQFGCITTANRTILLTELGTALLNPISDEELIQNKVAAVKNPSLYQKLIERFENHELPKQNILENILVREYRITDSSKSSAAETFLKCMHEVGADCAGVLSFSGISTTLSENTTTNNAAEDLESNMDPAEQNQPNDNTTLVLPETQFVQENEEYEAPLTIPMGKQRKAILYMPVNADAKDAEYVKNMINMMFTNLYGLNGE